MTVSDILKQVRWCVDEESNHSDFADQYFDNIVKGKIGAALRWCALYADAALLNGSDTGTTGGLTNDYDIIVPAQGGEAGTSVKYKDGYLTLPNDAIRVSRVKVSSWHKGVSKFISEDSDEYLMQYDETSMATVDRPVSAIIQTTPIKVQLFPKPEEGDKVEISLIVSPSDGDIASEVTSGTVSIPPKLATAFIYYLAYLVMIAHCDSNKASLMLAVAKEQIAINITK